MIKKGATRDDFLLFNFDIEKWEANTRTYRNINKFIEIFFILQIIFFLFHSYICHSKSLLEKAHATYSWKIEIRWKFIFEFLFIFFFLFFCFSNLFCCRCYYHNFIIFSSANGFDFTWTGSKKLSMPSQWSSYFSYHFVFTLTTQGKTAIVLRARR